jgi:hypothetical protein
MTTTTGLQPHFWQHIFQEINSRTDSNLLLPYDTLCSLLDRLALFQASVFEQDSRYEPFFTALLTYLSYSLLGSLETRESTN